MSDESHSPDAAASSLSIGSPVSSDDEPTSAKTPEQLAREILNGLDEFIHNGPWDKSLFLTVTGNRLKEVRRQFLEDLGMKDPNESIAEMTTKSDPTTSEASQDVYVELYNIAGADIQKWLPILQNISRYGVSRPVYLDREEANQVLRTKENKQNSAIVVISVASSQLTKTDVPNSTITKVSVRDNALSVDAIRELIHVSGVYVLKNKQLVRQGDASFHA